MKYLISIAVFIFLTTASAMAQENLDTEDSGTPLAEEQLPGTADRMLDLQSTRIMEIEDDLHALRRELSRQISDLEEQLVREQTIIKEYIEILRGQTSALETRMERRDSDREALGRDVDRMQEDMARLQGTKDELQDTVSGILLSQEELEGKLGDISQALTSLQKKYEEYSARTGEIQAVKAEMAELDQAVTAINDSLNRLSTRMDTDLEKTAERMHELEQGLEDQISELTQKISFTDEGLADRLEQTDSGLRELDKLLEERTLMAGAVGIAAVLAGVTGMLLGLATRRRFKKYRLGLEQRVKDLALEFQEQQTHQDSRLAELMENLAAFMPEPGKDPASGESRVSGAEMDHSLAISLGNELYRMIKKIKDLPEEDSTAEELKASLNRVYRAYNQKGYQIVDLEGKPYKEKMDARAEFILTPELLPGEQIVYRVIKPQIKYGESTVQKAEIEVLVGE